VSVVVGVPRLGYEFVPEQAACGGPCRSKVGETHTHPKGHVVVVTEDGGATAWCGLVATKADWYWKVWGATDEPPENVLLPGNCGPCGVILVAARKVEDHGLGKG
jgi:hypothetical protein